MSHSLRRVKEMSVCVCVCVPANVRTYLRCEAKAMLIHILFVSRNYEGGIFLYLQLSKYLSVFMKKHKNYKSLFGNFFVAFWVPYGPQNRLFWGPYGVHMGPKGEVRDCKSSDFV